MGVRGQRLFYGRHFAVLACLAVVLAAASRWRPLGTVDSFGLYGALHALAVVVSLRRPGPLIRKLAFIIIASALSVFCVVLGFHGRYLIGALPGSVGPLLLLAMSSGFGTASYAALVKAFWIDDLSLRAMATMVLCCVSATLIAARIGGLPKSPDGLWLALPWWFAFSAVLRCFDPALRRDMRTGVRPPGDR